MKVCIPVSEIDGLDSPICAHFGSAPAFLIIDSESETWRAIPNSNPHHSHGVCMPLRSLRGESIDCLIVGGIGMGALNKLNAADIKVFASGPATVAQALAALKAGTLAPMQPGMTCAGHGHQH